MSIIERIRHILRLNEIDEILCLARENKWAHVFHDTIKNSPWLLDQSFSPGEYAANYAFLYLLYRVLSIARPRHILELGLGQTTKMIAQFAASEPGVHHCVVEHNPEWIAFFQREHAAILARAKTEIKPLVLTTTSYGKHPVRSYAEFRQTFQGQKFDFICIDGPMGFDMRHFSRIDVLQLMPDILAEKFVVVMHDVRRSGEAATFARMQQVLKKSKIEFARGFYTSTGILCSSNWAFLTTV